MTNREMQTVALNRAQSSQALTNLPAVYAGFLARGIPESEILPRVNVLTFHAWKALGRSVRKGEHGVSIFTWIERARTDPATGDVKRWRSPRSTTVFHVSQTDADSQRVS